MTNVKNLKIAKIYASDVYVEDNDFLLYFNKSKFSCIISNKDMFSFEEAVKLMRGAYDLGFRSGENGYKQKIKSEVLSSEIFQIIKDELQPEND